MSKPHAPEAPFQPRLSKSFPDTTQERRARGRVAKALGDAVEERFKAHFALLASRGCVVKIPTPVQIKRALKGGQVVGELRQPVAPDFLGWWKTPEGMPRFVAVEVKHAEATDTNARRFVLADKLRTDKEGHQGLFLDRLARDGGVAAVFVWRQEGNADYLIPIHPDLGDLPSLARPSWTWEALEPWKMPPMATLERALSSWERYSAHGWAAMGLDRMGCA